MLASSAASRSTFAFLMFIAMIEKFYQSTMND